MGVNHETHEIHEKKKQNHEWTRIQAADEAFKKLPPSVFSPKAKRNPHK